MIISFSGKLGAGKSTIAKALSEKLGMKRYYMGEIFRRVAKEKGMTVAEFGALCEKDPKYDKEIDEYQTGKEANKYQRWYS